MPTWILALDASTPRCSIAIGQLSDDGELELVAGDADDDAPNQASTRLLGRLRAQTERAGILPNQLDVIACGRGPGTFTGTRVAVATAKGIGLGLGLPLAGLSTLAAVALSAETSGWTLPLLDARRGEVYGALFEIDLEGLSARPQSDEQCTPLTSLVASLKAHASRPIIPIGPGVAPYAEALPSAWGPAVPCPGPSPLGVLRAAAIAHRAALARPPAELDAVYLRKSYAELGVNPPKRRFVKSPFV